MRQSYKNLTIPTNNIKSILIQNAFCHNMNEGQVTG